MSCTSCGNCEDFCTSEITCVDANFTNISVSAEATLNDVLEAIDVALEATQGDKGDKGDKGDTGVTGVTGATGNPGANTMFWGNTNTSSSAGGFNGDTTTFSTITSLSFNKTSLLGYAGTIGATSNALDWLNAISVGDTISVRQSNDSEKFGIYTVTSVSYSNPVKTIGVSVVASNSTLTASSIFTISYVKKGTAGSNGTNGVDASAVVGGIQMFAGSSAPDGYLLCLGQQVLRSTYANLFSVIGTTYGAGDGSTTFNLPDLQGNVPLGTNGSTYLLGQKAGSATHLIDANELPAHTHPVNDSGHTHPAAVESGNVANPSGAGAMVTSNMAAVITRADVMNSATTGITVGNNSTTHTAMSLMQPYIVLNFIIKH